MKITHLLFILPFFFCGCIEIIDDITVHNDGTGSFKYSINLSSSKIKVNSILALDSLNGKKVPDMTEILEKIQTFKNTLETQPGISNVKTEFNQVEFILKVSCDFTNVVALQNGIKETLVALSKEKNTEIYNSNWITWDGKTLSRMIPNAIAVKAKSYENSDLDLLKNGSYTSISRFDRAIDKTTNVNAKINPAKTATMLRVNTYDLRQNNHLIENTISLTPN
jgi:hypothetical protein